MKNWYISICSNNENGTWTAYTSFAHFLQVTCVFVFLMTLFSEQTVSILIKLMISSLVLHFVLVSQQRDLAAVHFLFLFSLSVHCSQAVLVDRTLYISGQLGMDPSSGQLVPGGVKEEAKQVGHFPHWTFPSLYFLILRSIKNPLGWFVLDKLPDKCFLSYLLIYDNCMSVES